MPQPPAMSAGYITAMLGDQDTLHERVQAELPPEILARLLYSIQIIRDEIGLGSVTITVMRGQVLDVTAEIGIARNYK